MIDLMSILLKQPVYMIMSRARSCFGAVIKRRFGGDEFERFLLKGICNQFPAMTSKDKLMEYN
jgi:hypothetical protein